MLIRRSFNVLWGILLLVRGSYQKFVKGKINTKDNWAFLERFCFKDDIGRVSYSVNYPAGYEVQNLLLYFDTQWPRTYPKPGLSCIEREDTLYRDNNQVINLTTDFRWSGCKEVSGDLFCDGVRRFVSTRERWWYIAVSNCKSSKGLRFTYEMNFTNGQTFWTEQFSADERHVLQTDITYLCLFIILLCLGIYVAGVLVNRRLFHTSFKLFLCSLICETMSLIIYIAFYINYGKSGVEVYAVKVVARAFHFIAHVLILLMLVLMGKGWTVTRGRISSTGQIKLSVFCTLYVVCFGVLFIYEAALFDPGKVLYIYESAAGVGICVLRVIAWLWFCYGIFFTLKHYPSKSSFYYPFWFFYTAWFLAGPIIVIVSAFLIPKYKRAKVVNGIDWGVSLLAHVFFLVITRPSAANKNFPFHLRTNQIGVCESSPSPSRPSVTAGGCSYAVPSAPPPYTLYPGDMTMFQASGLKKNSSGDVRNSTSQNGTLMATFCQSPALDSSS